MAPYLSGWRLLFSYWLHFGVQLCILACAILVFARGVRKMFVLLLGVSGLLGCVFTATQLAQTLFHTRLFFRGHYYSLAAEIRDLLLALAIALAVPALLRARRNATSKP